MRLYVLSLGQISLDKGRVLTPGVDDGHRVNVPVPAYLLQTDDGKNVVIDTGLHPVHVKDPDATTREFPNAPSGLMVPFMRPEDSIVRRLAALDLAPGDVDYVVNTHLHFDHCGGNTFFGGVPILVQRNHYEYARESESFPSRYFDLPHLAYELIDGEVELFGGVRTILTPGHAPWHQSLLVSLPHDGNVLICADAIDCQDNLDHDAWGAQRDPDLARESAQKLLRLAGEHDAQLFYGHDVAQWEELRLAPAFYS
ncbi:MAG: N-acyl homoserine lactonase family protein [Candidatus Dormiibacterota bacterium]